MSIDIPPELNWLVEMAAGQSWPQGDEDKLSELGDGWNTAAVQLHDVVDGVGEATSAVQGGFNGPAADQFTSFMNSLYTSIPQMAQGAEQIGSMAKDTALQIEYSKYMILLQLLWMAEQIAEWTSTIFGAAAVPAIEAAGRFTVQAIIKTLMKQVARSVGESVAAMVGMDVAVQTIQFLKGDRTHWNTSATIGALEMGALSGAVGGIVGVGAHVIAPDIMKTFVGHVGLGAANGAIIGGVSDLVFGSDGNIGFAAAAGALGGAAGHRRGGGGGPGPLNLHIDVDDDPGGPPPAYHKVADDQPPPYSARPEPAPVNGSGEHSSANGSSNGSVNGTANGTGNSTANNTANGAAHGGGNTGDESNIPLTSPAPDYTAASAPAAAPAAASGHETGTDTPAEDQASSPLPATESADAPAAATGTGSASASTGANGAARGSDSSSSAESSTATSSATSGPARSTSDSSSGLTSSASPSTGIRTTSQPSETAASGSSNHYSGLPGLESTTPQPHAAAVGPTAQVGSGEAHSAQAPATQHVSAPASTPTPHESATATPPPAAHAQSPQPTQTHPTATSSEPLPAPHATTAPAAPHTVESPQASHTSQTLHSAAPAPVAHDSSSAAPASGDQRPAGLPGLEGGPTPVAAQAEAHAAPQPDDHAATESPAPTVGAGSSAAMHTPASGPTRDSATGDTSPPPETELPPPSVRTQSDTGSTQHTDPATASPTSVRTESEPAPASDGVGETRAAAPAEAPAVSTHSEDPSPAPNGDQHVTFGSSGGNDSRRAPGAGGDDFSNLVTRTLENSRGRFGRAFVGPDDQARLEQHIGNFDASIGQVAHVAKNGDEWESSGPRSQVPWDPTKPHYIAEVHTSDDGGFSVAVSSGKTSLTPGQFGGVLRRRPSFTGRPEDAPLVLAACEAARPGPDGIAPAQHLADETGATVYAPTSDVVALEDGTGNFALTNDADGNRGAWVKFEPRTVPAPEPVRTVSSPGAHGDSETSNPDVSHSGSNAPVTFTRGGSSSTARPAAGHQDRPGQQQPHAEQPQQAPNTGGHGKIVTRAGGRVVGKPTNAVEADFYRKIRALPEDDPLRQIVPRPYTEAEVAHLETQIAAGVEHPTLPTGPATEHPAGGTDHPAPTSGPSVERPAPSSDHPAPAPSSDHPTPAPAPAAAPAAQHPAPGHDDSQVLIENITHGMNDPHLLDVKIGARTASRTELERHLSAVSAQIKKWKLKVADKTTGSSSRGYRVVGGTGIKSGTAGERATAGRASDTHIRGYAAPEEGSIQDLAHQLHQQVLHIADVVKGSGHTAIAASVLMAVDRHPGPGAEGAVQAKLIDFAHTFGPDDPGMSRDQFDKYSNNFDEGIRNLAKTLGDIAESQPARPGHDEAAPSTSAPPADTRTTPAPIAHQHTETDTPAPQDSTTAGPADRPAPAPTPRSGSGREPFTFGDRSTRTPIRLETGDSHAPAEAPHTRPDDTAPVAAPANTGGHGGIQRRAGGQVLEKPTNQVESDFYQMVRQLPADDPLRQVVPRSYTAAEVAHMEGRPAQPGGGGGDPRVYIENITHGMTDPHVLDIKIGAKTASKQELLRHLKASSAFLKKYKLKAADKVTGSASRGYRVVGGTGISGGRSGIGRNSETHLRGYANPDEGSVEHLAQQLHDQVQAIADAAAGSGRTYIGASVLMAVDRQPDSPAGAVRATLIDFAHAFGPGDEGMSQAQYDKYADNFNDGINNLTRDLGGIAHDQAQAPAAVADPRGSRPAALGGDSAGDRPPVTTDPSADRPAAPPATESAPVTSDPSEDRPAPPASGQHVAFGSGGAGDSHSASGAGHGDFTNLVTHTLENSRGRFGRAFVGPDDQARLEQHFGNFDASIGQIAHLAMNGDHWEPTGERSEVPWDPTKPHYIAEVHTSDEGNFNVAVSSGKTSLSAGQFGGVLRRRPSFTGRPEEAPLVLVACQAAVRGPDGVAPAQHLADETGATVYAPTSDVVALEDGTGNFALTTDADGNRGQWVKFEPRTSSTPVPEHGPALAQNHASSISSDSHPAPAPATGHEQFAFGGKDPRSSIQLETGPPRTSAASAAEQSHSQTEGAPPRATTSVTESQQAPNTGGHGGITTRAGGQVLEKPTNQIESDFYQMVRQLPADDPLRQVVPHSYTGAEVAHMEGRPAPAADQRPPGGGSGDSRIYIENITHGMTDPHLLDIKIGARTASRTELERNLTTLAAQIKKLKIKAVDKATGSSSRGYRVVGGTGISGSGAIGRAVVGRESDTHIRGYTAPEEGSVQDLAHQLQQKVLEIADAVGRSGQTAIAASVLMAVDRHPGGAGQDSVRAKLIDFAHAFGPGDEGMSQDQFDKYNDNFDEGIRNLAKTLGDIAQSRPATSTAAAAADTHAADPAAHTPAPAPAPADRPATTSGSGPAREPFTFGDHSPGATAPAPAGHHETPETTRREPAAAPAPVSASVPVGGGHHERPVSGQSSRSGKLPADAEPDVIDWSDVDEATQGQADAMTEYAAAAGRLVTTLAVHQQLVDRVYGAGSSHDESDLAENQRQLAEAEARFDTAEQRMVDVGMGDLSGRDDERLPETLTSLSADEFYTVMRRADEMLGTPHIVSSHDEAAAAREEQTAARVHVADELARGHEEQAAQSAAELGRRYFRRSGVGGGVLQVRNRDLSAEFQRHTQEIKDDITRQIAREEQIANAALAAATHRRTEQQQRVAQDYAAEIRRVEQVEARTSADLAARAELLRSRAQMYRPDQLAVYQRQLRDERRTLVTQSRDERARLGAIQRSALRDIDARYTQDRHQALEHLARVDATRRDVPDELIRRQRAALNRMVDNVVDSLMAEQRDARFYNARPMAARELAEFRRELPRIQTKLKKLVVDPKGYKGYHPILERNIGQHPDYGAKQHSVKVDNHTDLVRNVKGWVEAKPNRHREKLIARQVEADGHVERMVDVLSRRLYRHIQRLPNSEQIMAELGRGRSDFNGEPLGSYMPYFSRAKLPRELQHLATPIWDRGGIPAVLRDPGSFSLRDKMIAVHDLFEYFSTANHTPQTRGTNLLPVESDDNKYNTTAIDRRGRRIEATTDRGQNPVRQPDGRVRIHPSTRNENEPSTMLARDLRIPVWAGQSFTAMRMFKLAEWAGATKYEMGAVAWGIFSFWRLHYDHTTEYSYHTLHEVMDVAQNFGVSYSLLDQTASLGRVNPQSAVTDAIGLADNLLAGRVPVTDHGMVIDFDQSELTALAMNLTRAVRTAMDTGSSRNLRALLDAIQATEAQLGANVPL
jgi:hypothetical protein